MISNVLVDMYVKSEALAKARECFDGFQVYIMISLIALNLGYANQHDFQCVSRYACQI